MGLWRVISKLVEDNEQQQPYRHGPKVWKQDSIHRYSSCEALDVGRTPSSPAAASRATKRGTSEGAELKAVGCSALLNEFAALKRFAVFGVGGDSSVACMR